MVPASGACYRCRTMPKPPRPIVKPSGSPEIAPEKTVESPPAGRRLAETAPRPFAMARKDRERLQAQHQRERAAVKQRAMGRGRKGR